MATYSCGPAVGLTYYPEGAPHPVRVCEGGSCEDCLTDLCRVSNQIEELTKMRPVITLTEHMGEFCQCLPCAWFCQALRDKGVKF